MKSKYLGLGRLAIIIATVVLISGCIQQKQETVTCDPPYIKVGTTCCLDQNSNNICDKDEPASKSDKDTAKRKMPDSLKYCLEQYVYGKEGNWEDSAYEHCELLLPYNCFLVNQKEILLEFFALLQKRIQNN
ncbi:MAG: hypothetical protein A7316_06505 [Candidatus Altiarchaeales archaeon WOR_SM1_86-2]|nr:MAG: hypothetical protein A7316_06505 [Candidatus Altiarchaeales archaeon WOR_SM1_86-2]